ncbi:alpha/beta hydrolase [Coraliomargarita parva]|uniref:alpha/beta hydrolase n=1 Tax=Coraliomargarita parva TaxID=3014050 RepID=UPI0022B2B2E6|nr:alpha/beta hydrolase family protein [Coraliomargarita parva]
MKLPHSFRPKATTCALLLGLVALGATQPCMAGVKRKLEIPSESMGKQIPAFAIVPDSYKESTDTYPVVYLLHGKGGTYSHWQNAAPLTDLADQYQTIIICPDGDKDSWYLDSPDRADSQYMTHIVKEVVDYVDATLRTKASREYRAIAGNSMGGHGAMLAALKHPDVFGAVGSMSGVLDLMPYIDSSLGASISKRIGDQATYPERWKEASVIENLDGLKDGELAIIIDCGTGDHFLRTSRAVHEALKKAKINHMYIERTGGHTWSYWKTEIEYQMLFFHKYFEKAKTVSE